ncbi:YibE/F family protein [Janibacter terrae]|jgi:uncharacterized membrane protein|uniref:YibE/F family protein n=1 Tax=Janibacter terrae TaxID=103817 RepID=A0ABZ2FHP7_9MICO
MGSHSAPPQHDRLRRLALLIITPLALLTVVGLVWLWPAETTPGGPGGGAAEHQGRVTAVQQEECTDEALAQTAGCGTATVQLEDGQALEDVQMPGAAGARDVSVGDDVVVLGSQLPEGWAYAIVDHQRGPGLWVLGLAFALTLIAFGRWRGLTSLAGLAVTFVVLLAFVVPAILAGEPPLLVALVGSSAIMLTVLYLTHGFSLTTTMAVIGTVMSFVLTGLLAAVAVWALHLTGITDDDTMAVQLTHGIDMTGLLLAGIVIGSLGILDDVTVTQAVTVDELARANPGSGPREVYTAATRIGRSHIASVVNTIVLAYAGASLPLFILVVANNSSFGSVLTSQFVAQEIVRSIVATLGLIAAVPITTGLAALALRHQQDTGRPVAPSTGHHH